MHVHLRTQRDWDRLLAEEGMPRELPSLQRTGIERLVVRWQATAVYQDKARAYFWRIEQGGWRSPEERRVWGLHVFNGLTAQEIAERMGWPSKRTPAAHGGWSPGAQRVHLILTRHRKAAGLTRDKGLIGPRVT